MGICKNGTSRNGGFEMFKAKYCPKTGKIVFVEAK